MIRGLTVTVYSPVDGAKDRFGNVTHTWTSTSVEDVLIAPATTFDLEAARPEGDSSQLALHFPKTYSGSLEHCEIGLPDPWGGRWKVLGDPKPYMAMNTPTRWHMPVTVERADG